VGPNQLCPKVSRALVTPLVAATQCLQQNAKRTTWRISEHRYETGCVDNAKTHGCVYVVDAKTRNIQMR